LSFGIIQKTLGHKNIQTTYDLYIKESPEGLRGGSNKLGNGIGAGADMSKVIQLKVS